MVNYEKKLKRIVITLAMMFAIIFTGLSVSTKVSHAAGITLGKYNLSGTIMYDKSTNVKYYRSSYARLTCLLPYQSDWETGAKQNALLGLKANQNTTTGPMMATAGFKYQGNNNIKLYAHNSFIEQGTVYNTAHTTLTDGTKVEFRNIGYTVSGDNVANDFFLIDNVKDVSFPNNSRYETRTIAGTSVKYKITKGDHDGVRGNIDLLSRDVGNAVVLDGVATNYNNTPSKAQLTFKKWFEGTTVGKNHLNYAIKYKNKTADTAWEYWNQYFEIQGDIEWGSVVLYSTTNGGMQYRTYAVPSEGPRNMVSHQIFVYDSADKRVGYAIRDNTNYIYADYEEQQSYVELAKGVKYRVEMLTKFLVSEDEFSKSTNTTSQVSTLKVYYGDNILSKISDAANTQNLTNNDGVITGVKPVVLGGKTFYWVTTKFEAYYTVPRNTTADKGAFDLIIPRIYQENGDNLETLDDTLLLNFNIIDLMDMKFTDYNVSAKRRWQTGDTANAERVWIEDLDGNKLEYYTRNEPFYICYAYEQCSGEDSITDPSLDAIIYRAASASIPKGVETFNGMLTQKTTITVDSDPVIYKQLAFVEFPATQDKNTYIPDGALIIENTPFLNVYACISDKHTRDEGNNFWVTQDDTCAGQIGTCVKFKALPADMEIIKVIFTDDEEIELKEDYASQSTTPDEKDTVGYYDRDETVKIEYEFDQTVYANINIPNPTVRRIIYQGVKNPDGTVRKYLDGNGNPVVLKSGSVQSEKTLWYGDMGNGEDKVRAWETISTTAEALYIEYAIDSKHYFQLENDESDSWHYVYEQLNKPFIATISCTIADMELEREIILYDTKNNPNKNIPNIGETVRFGFNVLHMGDTKEEMMAVGGSRFNPYVTLNVKVIDNDKTSQSVTTFDQLSNTDPAIIGMANINADTILYPGRSVGWIPKVEVELSDVQLPSGNITVCAKIATVHDANLSNIIRDAKDEYCQVFKTEQDFSVVDLAYVPTKSVSGITELGFSVTVNSLGGQYADKKVILQPIMSVYNYNYDTSTWERIYRSQINIAKGEWIVTEINIPEFEISNNPVKPTRLRVSVNDKLTPADWKYQEYVLRETDVALNTDPYQNNYKEITVVYSQPDYTICPECTVQ